MTNHRLIRLLVLFILMMGIAMPVIAFSTPAVSVAYAQDTEEGAAEEEAAAEVTATTGDQANTTGAAVVGGILALVIVLIFVVAIISAVSLGVIGIGAVQISGGED